MQVKNNITDISLEMDKLYGEAGIPEREAFRLDAYVYCTGQIVTETGNRYFRTIPTCNLRRPGSCSPGS